MYLNITYSRNGENKVFDEIIKNLMKCEKIMKKKKIKEKLLYLMKYYVFKKI